ncbi:hypothetical protein CLV93_10724 [Prolixibacter denitrificans]|uniref:Uncharacterized protein n=1 Tax=Prolixibacter denitrificans TaxID=1541063 RepID=A0A2P8CAD5_9BACT|nr:hypothetical protein CLV93_10724 [Prolixibacter denitrificans]
MYNLFMGPLKSTQMISLLWLNFRLNYGKQPCMHLQDAIKLNDGCLLLTSFSTNALISEILSMVLLFFDMKKPAWKFNRAGLSVEPIQLVNPDGSSTTRF